MVDQRATQKWKEKQITKIKQYKQQINLVLRKKAVAMKKAKQNLEMLSYYLEDKDHLHCFDSYKNGK